MKPVLIQGRDDHIKTIERFNILKEYFENKHGYKVNFLGNPLLDSVNRFKSLKKIDFYNDNISI